MTFPGNMADNNGVPQRERPSKRRDRSKGKRGGKGRDRGEKKPAVPPALVRGPKPRQRKPEAYVEAPVLETAAVEEEGIVDPPAGDVETPSEAMPTDDSDSSSA